MALDDEQLVRHSRRIRLWRRAVWLAEVLAVPQAVSRAESRAMKIGFNMVVLKA